MDASGSFDPNHPENDQIEIEWKSQPELLFDPEGAKNYSLTQEDFQVGEKYTVTIWVHREPLASRSDSYSFPPSFSSSNEFSLALYFEGDALNNGESVSIYSTLKAERYEYPRFVWETYTKENQSSPLSN